VGLDPSKSARVLECLEWWPEAAADSRRRQMRETLRLLAVKGFAPIPKGNDPIAEVGVRFVDLSVECMRPLVI
jgi:hypothetical protein